MQGDLKSLVSKLKLKNTVTIQQEKLLAEKEEKLQKEQKELQEVENSLRAKQQEVTKFSPLSINGVKVCLVQVGSASCNGYINPVPMSLTTASSYVGEWW